MRISSAGGYMFWLLMGKKLCYDVFSRPREFGVGSAWMFDDPEARTVVKRATTSGSQVDVR